MTAPDERLTWPTLTQPDPARSRRWGLLGCVLLLAVGTWITIPVLDRAVRTSTVPQLEHARSVHPLPDGRLVVADARPNGAGRVVIVDPATLTVTVAMEPIAELRAADIGPDGTVCALDGSRLACSDGSTVELGGPVAGLEAELASAISDLLSDRRAGWFVADPGRSAILHVDDQGTITVHATFHRPEFGPRPVPLALAWREDADDPGLGVALDRFGVAHLPVTRPAGHVTTWRSAPGPVVGVVPSQFGDVVLVNEPVGRGRLGSVRIKGDLTLFLDGINDPRGLAATAEVPRRYAVVTAGRVLLVRPPS